MKSLNIGVLSFHGSVLEHIEAAIAAAEKIKLNIKIIEVRTKKNLKDLDALIIPGGESTTIYKLCQREGMLEKIRHIKNIFGTCAGAIFLAKLELVDIVVDRNAYGRQRDSFEKDITTKFGRINAVFIRAPKIKSVGRKVQILAEDNGEILACEQKAGDNYYLSTCFHPELTSTIFHEYFLKQI